MEEILIDILRNICDQQMWDRELTEIMLDECAPEGSDKAELLEKLRPIDIWDQL